MPQKAAKKQPRKKKTKRPLVDLLPGLLVNALAKSDDFILTCETDPDTEKKQIHVITGRFVTPCMLRKLLGQAESQKDEGATILTRDWT